MKKNIYNYVIRNKLVCTNEMFVNVNLHSKPFYGNDLKLRRSVSAIKNSTNVNKRIRSKKLNKMAVLCPIL
jgi:hypothetical protein